MEAHKITGAHYLLLDEQSSCPGGAGSAKRSGAAVALRARAWGPRRAGSGRAGVPSGGLWGAGAARPSRRLRGAPPGRVCGAFAALIFELIGKITWVFFHPLVTWIRLVFCESLKHLRFWRGGDLSCGRTRSPLPGRGSLDSCSRWMLGASFLSFFWSGSGIKPLLRFSRRDSVKLMPVLFFLIELSSETLCAWKFLYLKLLNYKYSVCSCYRTFHIIDFILSEL